MEGGREDNQRMQNTEEVNLQLESLVVDRIQCLLLDRCFESLLIALRKQGNWKKAQLHKRIT